MTFHKRRNVSFEAKFILSAMFILGITREDKK
jgi:hypothetical protein